MKTFEAAVDKTLADEDLLTANIASCRLQMETCERWATEIECVAAKTLAELSHAATTEPPDSVLARPCASFHIVFEWGKLVGMEMER